MKHLKLEYDGKASLGSFDKISKQLLNLSNSITIDFTSDSWLEDWVQHFEDAHESAEEYIKENNHYFLKDLLRKLPNSVTDITLINLDLPSEIQRNHYCCYGAKHVIPTSESKLKLISIFYTDQYLSSADNSENIFMQIEDSLLNLEYLLQSNNLHLNCETIILNSPEILKIAKEKFFPEWRLSYELASTTPELN